MTIDGELCGPASPRWAQALTRLRHDVYHYPGYVAVDADRLAGRPACFVYERSGHVLALPLVLRAIAGSDRLDATSPYGYPGPVSDTQDERFWDAAVAALLRCLAEHGVVSCFVRLHPLLDSQHAALARGGALVHHGDTVSMDLRLPEDEMWRKIRKDHRKHIRRARRQGLRTVVDDWRYFEDIVAIYRQTMVRVNASDEYFFRDEYFEDLRKVMDGRLHLTVVLAGDTPVGGGLLFEHDGMVHTHLGGTHSDHLSANSSKLELDDVRQWACARGNTALHLGGGLGGAAGTLFRFKAGFSDRRHAFHTWRIIVDADEYDHLAARGRGADVDGYFPAYRAPFCVTA